jgi:hypothetical protein
MFLVSNRGCRVPRVEDKLSRIDDLLVVIVRMIRDNDDAVVWLRSCRAHVTSADRRYVTIVLWELEVRMTPDWTLSDPLDCKCQRRVRLTSNGRHLEGQGTGPMASVCRR